MPHVAAPHVRPTVTSLRHRSWSLGACIGAALLTATAVTHAAAPEKYPSKPIRFIVPFAPGGGLDITARLIGQKLTEKWGQNVVIDTRPGAATIVGTEIAAHAPADGYTYLLITTTFSINPSLYKKLPYDPDRDFSPVTQLNSQPNIIVVNPSSPIKSVKDLIAAGKAKPGELSFASPGAGSAPHLAGELLKKVAGFDMTHIPYKGIPPAVTDVIGGRVTMLFTTTLSAGPHVKSGKLRALALTSGKRLPAMSDIPTVAESLPGYQAEAFQGMVAPAGVPRVIVEQMSAAVSAIVTSPEMTERFALDGAVPVGSNPKVFTAFIKSEMLKWASVIKDAGIKQE